MLLANTTEINADDLNGNNKRMVQNEKKNENFA